jgi:hypothetical protein
MIRLAFAGASGTGKTTLARWASETFDLPINPVGSRSVSKMMGFDNPYDVDRTGKRAAFQHRLVKEKRVWESQHDSFVTDRTTFDNLAYTILHDIGAVNQEFLSSTLEGLDRYTLVVVCPVQVFCKLGDDPHRVADPTYHDLYDTLLQALIQRYAPNLPTKILQSDQLERRKKELELRLRP